MDLQTVNISALRKLTAGDLRKLESILVVEGKSSGETKRLAAVVPYEHYLRMQQIVLAGIRLQNRLEIQMRSELSGGQQTRKF